MEFIESKIPFIEEKELVELSAEDRKWLLKAYPYFNNYFYCTINGVIYHTKIVDAPIAVNEILGKLISEYFKEKQLKSKIIKDEHNFYMLTENFIEKGNNYNELNSGLFPKLNRYDIDEKLELKNLDYLDRIKSGIFRLKTNQEDLIKLKYQLKAMIINDFLRKHSDRWYYNFLIEYKNTHCKLMPLYDFEYSFFQYDKELENSFIFNLSDKNTIQYIRKDEQFQEILYLAMNLNMKQIFERLFDEYPVTMTNYEIKHYENIIETRKEKIKKHRLLK